MKRMLVLLLAAMLILTLLPGCGKKDPGGDAPEVPENPTEQGGETPDVAPEPEPYVDPYEAVRTYWSEDQLTQSWGPTRSWSTFSSIPSSPIPSGHFMTAARARANATVSMTGW